MSTDNIRLETAPMTAGTSPAWSWHHKARLLMLAVVLASVALMVLQGAQLITVPGIVLFVLLVIPGIGGTVLALLSARQFDHGARARTGWNLIAFMAAADLVVFASVGLSAGLGASSGAALVIASTGLSSVSRVLAVVALFMMVSVYRSVLKTWSPTDGAAVKYRKASLTLHLRTRDFVAMGLVGAIGVTCIAFSGQWAQLVASGRPGMTRWVQIAGLPMLVALIPFSLLGVILWRYAAEMGGGLVAKAWRSVLLYGVLWLARTTFAGVMTYVAASSATSKNPLGNPVVALIWISLLLASNYMMFIGPSYQHEVSTSPVELSEEEINAIDACQAGIDR